MSKKLICLVSFVLVLSLASNASADLVAHWRLDDGSGTVATETVGNNDGTLEGDATWAAGWIVGALELDGDDYVDCGSKDGYNITEQITLAAWIKPDPEFNYPDWSGIIMRGGPNIDTFAFYYNGPNQQLGFKTTGTSTPWMAIAAPGLFDGEWHHVAAVYDGTRKPIYLDGEEVGSMDTTGSIETSDGRLLLGAGRDMSPPTHYLVGLIDDARIYDAALDQVEIQASMLGAEGFPFALGPNPADGAINPDTWANVSWRAGEYAVSHDIYFSDNFDDVNAGAESTFQGNQVGTFIVVGFPGFPVPDGLIPGTTYYWRIDEVNDAEPNSPWVGPVWSFMIPPKTGYLPDPADGAESVGVDETLGWTPGFGAKLHYVYFGDNFDEVDNAAGGLPQGMSTYDPGTLTMAKTYYWRVDEFDVVETHKGNVWSFTTEGAVTPLNPANGAVDITQTPVLTWSPGVFGASHEVYFGADAASLELKGSGNLGSESFEPGQLEWNTAYYWRVDEANNANADSPWTGPLWSFTTASFLIIDDFESYNDLDPADPTSNRIFNAWLDGFDNPAANGSVVGNANPPFAEQSTVNGGLQSMPMSYDNAVGKSEATLTLTSNRDWTVKGVTTLTIWFRGASANAAETLYVALNGNAVVNNDNPDAAQRGSWTQWNIDLQAFADQGVNLANVNSITLGLSSVTGGSGMMYFDDIRLNITAP
ncbi:MAG: LamG domain-containing protein [Planctomycetes bacterium]|nr:LamG domain-containing protein [Planctomycetota bacterium]